MGKLNGYSRSSGKTQKKSPEEPYSQPQIRRRLWGWTGSDDGVTEAVVWLQCGVRRSKQRREKETSGDGGGLRGRMGDGRAGVGRVCEKGRDMNDGRAQLRF